MEGLLSANNVMGNWVARQRLLLVRKREYETRRLMVEYSDRISASVESAAIHV